MKILSDKSSTAPEDTNSKPLIQLFTPSFAGLVEEKDYTAIAAKCLIPQGLDIPKPETVFDIEGIPVFTKKSLSTIIAKAKAGKTTVTAWIIAQVIKKGLTVLWLDT